MANLAPPLAVKLISEQIKQSQIHLSIGPQMTFCNTIIILSLKLIAPSATPIIHEHAHPQNTLTVTPFSILNGKYVKDKESTYKLLLWLIQLSDFSQKKQNEDFSGQATQAQFALASLLQMCQQLSEVATVLNQDFINPFYVFLNPVLKYRQYCKHDALKTKLLNNSQYFLPSGDPNIQYILHKFHILENWVKELKKKRLSLNQTRFTKICIIALMKHFFINSQKLYQAAMKQTQFEQIENKKMELISDLHDYYSRQVQRGQERRKIDEENIVHVRVQMDEQLIQQPRMEQTLIRACVKAAAGTLVMLALGEIFGGNK